MRVSRGCPTCEDLPDGFRGRPHQEKNYGRPAWGQQRMNPLLDSRIPIAAKDKIP